LSADFLKGPLLVSFFYNIRNRSLWRKKRMTTAAIHHANGNTIEAPLLVAFELSDKTWKRGGI
jgi:hypothetical protein